MSDWRERARERLGDKLADDIREFLDDESGWDEEDDARRVVFVPVDESEDHW